MNKILVLPFVGVLRILQDDLIHVLLILKQTTTLSQVKDVEQKKKSPKQKFYHGFQAVYVFLLHPTTTTTTTTTSPKWKRYNDKIWVIDLSTLLQNTTLPTLPSLFWDNSHDDQHVRMVRARYPNSNPEIDQWGYNSPNKLKYSIDSSEVLEWHSPPPSMPSPTFVYTDFRNSTTTTEQKDDSTMWEYNTYSSGYGGVCSSTVWLDATSAQTSSYWCGNNSAGGWAFVDRECAMSGQLQIPVGMTYNATTRHGQHIAKWHNTISTNDDDTNAPIIHAWHSQSWAMHMFRTTTNANTNASSSSFTFTKGSGCQGGRNWCRCDQCGYAGKFCRQHRNASAVDTRLISGTWMIENVLEELDMPGEYYFNTTSKLLYVYPNNTCPPDATTTEKGSTPHHHHPGLDGLRLSVLETVLDIRNATDITIRGIGFRDTAATYMGNWSAPSGGDWALHRGAAVFLENVTNVDISHCTFRRLDGTAVFVSRRARNVTIQRNVFEWLGENAIALWGDSDTYNATAGEYPIGTKIIGNVMRELGIYQKQSAGIAHNKAAFSTIRHNVIYNVPRAAMNFNDMLGGGDVVSHNLLFNTCRESGDHGPINSWDRQPYLTTTNATSSFVPATREISYNFIFANYGASQGIDTDDGSSWYHIHHNVFYEADGFKMDYGGHDSIYEDNVAIATKRTQSKSCIDIGGTFVPGHEHIIRRNICVVLLSVSTTTTNPIIISLEQCNTTTTSSSKTAIIHNNQYMTVSGDASVQCHYDTILPFHEYQSIFPSETIQTLPETSDAIMKIVQHQLLDYVVV